jgi:predicted CXXCH cytochrome family protein
MPIGGLIGTNLNNDHPIGSDAIYPSTASTSYNPAVPNTSGTSARITNANGTSLSVRAWVDGTGATKFVVSCGTCHNVHAAGGFQHMLRFSNANSAICLTCHIK